ncbi:MAG: hypothetical protein AAFW73_06940 [Bacteroidota bacterium]
MGRFGFQSPYPLAALLLINTLLLGYGPSQSDFFRILAGYLPFWGLAYWAYRRSHTETDVYFFLGLAALLRLSLLPALPLLSDDLYRFIWDGRLLVAGYNPFDQLPIHYLDRGIPGIDRALFDELNSPEYFTIYPPVAQGIFAIACWLFPGSIWGSTVVMKAFLLAFECGSLYLFPLLLRHFQLPLKNALLYALNPLVIIEVSGNLHFEGAMVFFLLLAIWYLLQEHWWRSALALALSIAAKLLPLIFLPLLLRRLGWWRSLRYYLVVGLAVLLLFAPLMSGVFLANFGDSLDLYFRRFEFNASLYYLLRWVGYQLSGYNLIAYLGPSLAGVVLLGVLTYTLLERLPNWKNLPQAMLFAIVLYLFCTTTVHPWYTILPVVLCLFTPYRFPILWSALIGLTYANYWGAEYSEVLGLVALEYGLVGILLLAEWRGLDAAKRLGRNRS